MIPKFYGIVKDHKVHLKDAHLYDKYMLSFKDEAKVEITVKKYTPENPDPIRKYYFSAVAKAISDETEHSIDVIHGAMKEKYSSHEDKKLGLLIIESVFSNNSKKSQEQKQEFVTNVKRWASDFLNLNIQ